jgi:hypothetical protein
LEAVKKNKSVKDEIDDTKLHFTRFNPSFYPKDYSLADEKDQIPSTQMKYHRLKDEDLDLRGWDTLSTRPAPVKSVKV